MRILLYASTIFYDLIVISSSILLLAGREIILAISDAIFSGLEASLSRSIDETNKLLLLSKLKVKYSVKEWSL